MLWSSCQASVNLIWLGLAVHLVLQIGGVKAPSPVGELGNVEMTQATELAETRWEGIGPDMLMTGWQLLRPLLSTYRLTYPILKSGLAETEKKLPASAA